MAQLVARPLWEREAVGSSPATPTDEYPRRFIFEGCEDRGVGSTKGAKHPDEFRTQSSLLELLRMRKGSKFAKRTPPTDEYPRRFTFEAPPPYRERRTTRLTPLVTELPAPSATASSMSPFGSYGEENMPQSTALSVRNVSEFR